MNRFLTGYEVLRSKKLGIGFVDEKKKKKVRKGK